MFLAKTGQILGNFASVGEKTIFWQGIMFLQTIEVSKKGGKSMVLSTENTSCHTGRQWLLLVVDS